MFVLKRDLKVSARYVTKKFEMSDRKVNKEKDRHKDEPTKRDFWALRGVSFDVYAGESIGLIGTNGSGKSTLANIIAGASQPTTGQVTINGKTSIIAIKSGLKKELTGRENIRLKCLLSGMNNKEVDALIDEIIAFADLDDFINQPLKNYSSGMKSRLGFAISVHSSPDVLIIDEALSVGDDTFYQRCVDKIYDFKAQGKTIFFVSHSSRQIRNLCDRVLWIHEGELKEFGPTEEVVDAYKAYVKWFKKLPKDEQRRHKKEQKRARKNFDLDATFQEILKENPGNQDQIESLFYPVEVSEQMPALTKVMIIGLIMALLALGGYYMSQLFN